jgi:hypothetical protein
MISNLSEGCLIFCIICAYTYLFIYNFECCWILEDITTKPSPQYLCEEVTFEIVILNILNRQAHSTFNLKKSFHLWLLIC